MGVFIKAIGLKNVDYGYDGILFEHDCTEYGFLQLESLRRDFSEVLHDLLNPPVGVVIFFLSHSFDSWGNKDEEKIN